MFENLSLIQYCFCIIELRSYPSQIIYQLPTKIFQAVLKNFNFQNIFQQNWNICTTSSFHSHASLIQSARLRLLSTFCMFD